MESMAYVLFGALAAAFGGCLWAHGQERKRKTLSQALGAGIRIPLPFNADREFRTAHQEAVGRELVRRGAEVGQARMNLAAYESVARAHGTPYPEYLDRADKLERASQLAEAALAELFWAAYSFGFEVPEEGWEKYVPFPPRAPSPMSPAAA